MPRPRRQITKDGYLKCTKCNQMKHIRDFWASKADSVWFVLEDPETGICESFGKPQSWCKDCVRAHQAKVTKPEVLDYNHVLTNDDLQDIFGLRSSSPSSDD